MVRINIYIAKKQHKALKELSKNGIKMSEHIRRAIDLYLTSLKKAGDNSL